LNKLKQFSIFHPFLFAIFPILFLFAYNIDEVPATDLLLPMLVVIVGTLILLLSLRLITKNCNKIGIVTTFFMVLFFSYSRGRDVIFFLGIGRPDTGGFHITSHLFLTLLWVLLFITGAFFIIKSHRDFSISTKFLNIVAIALVAISFINIGIYGIKTPNHMPEMTKESDRSLRLNNPDNLPDIYYIILDEYARQDTLKEVFNYNNSEFIDYLTSKGFYVATKSCSNYSSTCLSLPSSLNMDYLTVDELANAATQLKMIGNNRGSRFLKEKGYRYIFVGGGIDWKGIAQYTDEYFVYKSESVFRKSAFVHDLVCTTALLPFTMFFDDFFDDYDRKARLYAFDKLADIPDIEEPTFVYAHIMSPHPPFLFDRGGNPAKQNISQPGFPISNRGYRQVSMVE